MRDEYGFDEDQIRAWADRRDILPALHLLRRAFDGAYFSAGYPWMIPGGDDEQSWVDFEAIPGHLDMVKNPKARKVLLLAASLADVRVKVDLADALEDMDEDTVRLVLAAIAEVVAAYEPGSVPAYPWP